MSPVELGSPSPLVFLFHLLCQVGHIDFFSATYRLFKLPELERDCEDYGEAVIYKGTVTSSPKSFTLDNHHVMDTGRVFPVCRNTLHMLTGTRFARHFEKVCRSNDGINVLRT